MSVTDRYRRQIRENLPVVFNGLTFHPLTVRDYDLYTRARESFELMLGSLQNPKIARLPWCAALWALDQSFAEKSGETGFFLVNVLCVMAVALRLDAYSDPEGGGRESIPIRPAFSQTGELVSIAIGFPHSPDFTVLTMQQMDDVRKIIAAQNGYEIPDENWNPELVAAAQYNAQLNNNGIVPDRETLIFSVAAQYRTRPMEIYDWPIREFVGIVSAIDRAMNYQICATAEMTGTKFTHGNPYPTWKFDRKAELPTGFRTLSEIEATTEGMLAGG